MITDKKTKGRLPWAAFFYAGTSPGGCIHSSTGIGSCSETPRVVTRQV